MEHLGCAFQEHFRSIDLVLFQFSRPGTLQSHWLGNCKKNRDRSLRKHHRNILWEHLQCSRVLSQPGHHSHTPGTPQMYQEFPHSGNCKENCRENSGCACSVLDGYNGVTLSMSLQCTCDVPGRNNGSCPQCPDVETVSGPKEPVIGSPHTRSGVTIVV
jgi:hypothetical protein